MAGQQNPAPASNPMVLSKPQPFDGTCGATAEAFVGKIGLHAVTYPKHFATETSKVVFAVLFMKDYAATWSQTYLDKVFNGEPVVFNDFNNFRSSFFDHNHRHHAKVALRNLRQTGTMLAYTQDINQHTRTVATNIYGASKSEVQNSFSSAQNHQEPGKILLSPWIRQISRNSTNSQAI
ncbi:uncharacterized protein VP01_513g8 [Puccinia sorghi]|uniref:Retrotransposon gag domain-containing protein n=1 Tax=Puccinia sorghi TaxID=27349 RepID=A0A0L6UL10_9BASI|nr:uncharacterized protein VP01_513g8 [Puccinia sorghi]